MALETVTYINDLDATNPGAADPKSQGDDHIRNTKTALLNCFAGFEGAVLVTGTDGGAVNAYAITPSHAVVAYVSRMIAVFSPTIDNTGTTTLNVSGLGAKALRSVSGEELVPGDLVAGSIYGAVYTDTEFRLLSITKNYADQLAFGTALPAQVGNAGKLITTDGTTAAWTDSLTIALNEAKGAAIASAATINLTTATGNFVHVTGTTTISAITIPSGAERTVVFDDALTLDGNAVTMILPTGANIVTAAGDTMRVRGDGAGNARVVSYTRASGQPLAGGQVLLGSVSVSAAANVDFLNVFSSAYDDYEVVIGGGGVTCGAAQSLSLYLAIAGVADTATNYVYALVNVAASGVASTSAVPLQAAASVTDRVTATIKFSSMNTASARAKFFNSAAIAAQASAGAPASAGLIGYHTGANVATGFRLYWSGGASFTAAGTVKVYGIAKT